MFNLPPLRKGLILITYKYTYLFGNMAHGAPPFHLGTVRVGGNLFASYKQNRAFLLEGGYFLAIYQHLSICSGNATPTPHLVRKVLISEVICE